MKTKSLYLECASGISGDMAVAALLSLGANRQKLDAVLKSLCLEGFDYSISEKKTYGLAGLDFDVKLLHEDEASPGHAHPHHSHHVHRNLADVYAVIDRGVMSDRARELAKKIFLIVAEAESRAHGCSLQEVHFHEVGAIDSIVDIVAAAVCFDDLEITDCIVTGLSEGFGYVRCQHGELPVPVPAVLNIAQAYKLPLRSINVAGELVTPTGIAIAAAFRTAEKLPGGYQIEQVGIGLGKKDVGRPNMLRAMILSEALAHGQTFIIETNIDDSTGEELGLAMEKLLNAGAFDVHFMPCFMKKNRPGWLLRVITDGEHLSDMERIIFMNTTTIGMRKMPVDRTCMKREWVSVQLSCGTVQIKKCSFEGIVRYYPEYESVKKIAEESGVAFRTVFNQAMAGAEAHETGN